MTEQTDTGFPTEPILRLNPEGHFALITRIDTDIEGRWLVSGAKDKTVKVWRLYSPGECKEIAHDADYGSLSIWADFAADGRLVTSSYDGKLRLYRPDGGLERSD